MHACAVTDVIRTLGSSPRGLSSATARTRLRARGPNELPPARGPAVWRQLAGQFTDLFAVVLMVASAITFVAYALQDPRDPGTLQLAVPITAVRVLAIDLGSDVLPALALGAEPPESDVMDRPPRPRTERLFSRTVVRRIAFLGGIQALGVCAVFFWHIHASGIPYADFTAGNPVYREAITMVQAGIVVSQFFNALAVRTERESVFRAGVFGNPWLIAAGLFGLALMAAISYLPLLQSVFHTAPLTAGDWALLAAVGVLPLAADEVRKLRLRGRTARPEGDVR
ncbi:hypothetical protein C1I97_01195 [Streptomyces sp. NTH33]|uniref:cation transporting ATPase C-terminal domain-containing protein n=1 Tax=Streptomyces sp. NTH33 TaxID=1735453 RepID=UPI000DA802B5|nr:cation transporting ATPase C-terminal domain-containing protein [Streptomyces sp. NTH33]PZH20806.1 hypothetical protein C1I97_01195 [Streptomyces sp. NTH33]